MQTSLGQILEQAQTALATDPRRAAALAAEAISRQPRNARALKLLADAQVRMAAYADAAGTLRQLIRLRGSDPGLHVELARACYTAGDLDAAIEAAARAVQLNRRFPGALANWLGMRLQRGEFEETLPLLAAAFDQHPDDTEIAMAFGEFAVALGRVPEAISRLEEHLARKAIAVDDRGIILYRLALLHEHQKEYGPAFRAAAAAKALRTGHWDNDAYDRHIDWIIRVFSREFLASAPRGAQAADRAVLVVGMFRSGTSLTEQILASHSRVFGAGELPTLRQLTGALMKSGSLQPEAARRAIGQAAVDRIGREYLGRLAALHPSAARITDKHPLNFELLGLAQLALPGARVIHCLRDPMDTCLSCYFTNFAIGYEYGNTLASLGRFYRAYQRLMAHWQEVLDMPMLEMRYEETVMDTENRIRRAVDFLGLEWEEDCLLFHQARRTALTPSNQQVRQPMYRTAMGRHRHYAAYLAELERALNT